MIALLILLTGLALIWQSNNEKALAPIQARNYFGQFPFLKTLNPQESDFAAFNRAVADLKTHPGIGEIPFSSETNTFFPIWKARDFRIGQTFSQWSDWAQPVEASREGLNDLVEASLIFPSHSGVDAKGEFMARSGHFLGQRRAVQSLFAGVVYDLSQTNSLTAIEYQKALLRLSQMCSQDYIYVNQIVRCTILSVALSGLQNVLELPDLTEEQLKEFQSLLNQVSFWSEIQNSLKLENAWRPGPAPKKRLSCLVNGATNGTTVPLSKMLRFNFGGSKLHLVTKSFTKVIQAKFKRSSAKWSGQNLGLNPGVKSATSKFKKLTN